MLLLDRTLAPLHCVQERMPGQAKTQHRSSSLRSASVIQQIDMLTKLLMIVDMLLYSADRYYLVGDPQDAEVCALSLTCSCPGIRL